jgi:hypothetical protein
VNATLTLQVARTAIGNAGTVGATLPKTVRADYDRLAALADQARHLGRAGNDICAAVLAALERDEDPYRSPDVIAAVIGHAIDTRRAGIDEALSGRAARFLNTHSPIIIESFGPAFDRHAETLTRCAEALDVDDLDDATAIVKKGGTAAQAWTDATAAARAVELIAATWSLLASVVPAIPAADNRYRPLIIANIDPDTYINETLAHYGVTPWQAARRGWLSYCGNAAGYRTRVDNLLAARARRDDVDAQFAAYHRQHHGAAIV